jgi:AcrR family transcriptional regulator
VQRKERPKHRPKATVRAGSATQTASTPTTRDRILNLAEKLFGEYGYNGVSLRAVSTGTDISLGQLQYYFKTKRDLFEACYLRHGIEITAERRERLTKVLSDAGKRPAKIRDLIRAFIEPFMKAAMLDEKSSFIKMHARLNTEPKEIADEIRRTVYDQTTFEFVEALARSLPHLPRQTLYWRFVFMIATYHYVLLRSGRLLAISKGQCREDDLGRAIEELVPFLEHGLTAPAES